MNKLRLLRYGLALVAAAILFILAGLWFRQQGGTTASTFKIIGIILSILGILCMFFSYLKQPEVKHNDWGKYKKP